MIEIFNLNLVYPSIVIRVYVRTCTYVRNSSGLIFFTGGKKLKISGKEVTCPYVGGVEGA